MPQGQEAAGGDEDGDEEGDEEGDGNDVGGDEPEEVSSPMLATSMLNSHCYMRWC